MKLEIYKSLWGMTGPLEAQFQQIAAAGYDGVEAAWPEKPAEFRQLLQRYRLKLVAMTFTTGPSPADHAASFATQLARAAELGPIKINAHSGRDCWSFDDQCRYFDIALAAAARQDLPVTHETHRHRILFTPWTAAALLQKFPTLRLTADFSHWCCVCESLLDDQADALALATARTGHIHARVGYEEGPQVPDPSAPEYARHLERHLAWWSAIIAAHRQSGAPTLTATPEFGPPAYLHTLPHTNVPVADLWSICLWMTTRLRQLVAPPAVKGETGAAFCSDDRPTR